MSRVEDGSKDERFEYVSLFSGCGGFDLGFAQAGFKCVGAIDIDRKALDVHKKNLAGPVYHFDLTSGLPVDLPSKVNIVLAGSPCQGFSTLGKRKVDDPRNALLLAGGRAAIRLGANVFVAENVLAVRSGEHKKYWDELQHLLHAAGYKTEEVVIDSRNLGLAQSRRRVFLLAWRTNVLGGVPLPTMSAQTLRVVLDGVDGLPNHEPVWLNKSSPEYIIAKKIMPGHKLSNVRNGDKSVHTWDIPEVFGETTSTERDILSEIIGIRRRVRTRKSGDADPLPLAFAHEQFGVEAIEKLVSMGYLKMVGKDRDMVDLANAFNGKYRRLSWESHSITVDTKFCNPHYYLHPDQDRGFSAREAARIQGFPDDFVFGGTNHDATLIGNAVAPPVAKYLAQYIKTSILHGT